MHFEDKLIEVERVTANCFVYEIGFKIRKYIFFSNRDKVHSLTVTLIKGEPELTDPFNLLINVKLRML